MLVHCYVEAVLADVTPGTDDVGYDFNIVVGHFADGTTESHGGW